MSKNQKRKTGKKREQKVNKEHFQPVEVSLDGIDLERAIHIMKKLLKNEGTMERARVRKAFVKPSDSKRLKKKEQIHRYNRKKRLES